MSPFTAEAAQYYIERVLGYLRNGIIGPSDIAVQLLSLGETELSFAAVLIEKLPAEYLREVNSYLYFYPITDYGWSQLPQSRPTNREQFTLQENRDIQYAQFQEDRVTVEHCRKLLRDRLHADTGETGN